MDRSLAIAIIEKQLAWLRDHDGHEVDANDLRWPSLLWPSPSIDEQLTEIQRQLAYLAERRPCRCVMNSSDGRNVMRMMTQVGASELDRGVDYIHRGLDGVRQLSICDPYLLKGRRDMSASESPRILRRLKSLRGLSHEEVNQVFT